MILCGVSWLFGSRLILWGVTSYPTCGSGDTYEGWETLTFEIYLTMTAANVYDPQPSFFFYLWLAVTSGICVCFSQRAFCVLLLSVLLLLSLHLLLLLLLLLSLAQYFFISGRLWPLDESISTTFLVGLYFFEVLFFIVLFPTVFSPFSSLPPHPTCSCAKHFF